MSPTNQLTVVRQAITEAMKRNPLLEGSAYDYVPGGGQGLPLGFTSLLSVTPRNSGQTTMEIELSCVVLFGIKHRQDTEEKLNAMVIGPNSMYRLLKQDETFGGTCVTSSVSEMKELNAQQMNAYQSMGYQWIIRVFIEEEGVT